MAYGHGGRIAGVHTLAILSLLTFFVISTFNAAGLSVADGFSIRTAFIATLGTAVVMALYLALAGLEQELEESTRDTDRKRRDEPSISGAIPVNDRLFNTCPDPVIITDREGTVRNANPEAEQLFGLPANRLIGKEITELFTETDKARIGFQQVLESGTVRNYPLAVRRAGETIPVLFSASVYHDEAGSIQGVLAIIRNVAEERRTEEALQASEEKYRLLVENLNEGIWMVDTAGTTTFINRRMAEILGYQVDEILGTHYLSYVDESDVEAARQHMDRRRSGVSEQYELALRRKDGVRINSIVSATPLFDAPGTYQGSIAAITDITRRKQVEAAVRESEERYRSFVQNFQGIAFRGTLDFRPIFLHGAVEAITGYTEEEIIRRVQRWELLIHPDDRERMAESTRELTTAPCRSMDREYRIIRKDGEIRWLRELSRNVCDTGGRPLFIDGAFYDITDRKHAEDALYRAEREKALILNTTAEMFTYYDTDLRVLWANRAAGASIGKKPEDLVGHFCYEVWHTRTGVCVGCPVVVAREMKKPREAEISTPDGRVWFIRGYPVTDESGAVVGLIEFGQEITDKKRAEKELRIKDMAMEASLNAISLIDLSLKIIYVNRAVLDLWRYTEPEDILGRPISVLWSDSEDLDRVGDALLREGCWSGELRGRRRDDTGFLAQISVTRVTAEDGTPLCYVGSAIDITERERAEEALRAANAYNRSLIEANLDPLVTIGPDGRITDVNTATEQVTGYARDELIGTDFSDYFIDPAEARAGYRRVFAEGQVHNYPLEIRHRDGHTTPVLYNATVYRDEAGKVTGVFAAARDITERKRAEEALKNQAGLLNLTHDSIMVLDMENRITFWNRGAEEQYGWTREETIGQVASRLLQTRFPEPLEVIRAALLREERWEGELVQTTREGRQIAVASRWALQRNEQGSPVAILEINNDITDRKRAEEALKESEERYRSLVELMPDAVVVHQDGTIVYVNPAGVRIGGGKSPEDFVGKSVYLFVHPEYRDLTAELLRRMQREGTGTPLFEAKLLTVDGRAIWVEITAIPILYQGRPSIMVVFRDITDRKRTEEALRISEEKYRTLVEGTNEVIFTVDTQGRITYISPALERLADYRVSEVVGEPFSRYIHPDDLPGLQASFARTLTGVLEPYEFRVLARDGSVHHVLTSSRPLMDDGRLMGLIGVLTDITDRKRAEEALRASEEKFRGITQRSFDMIYTCYLEGGINYMSPAVERILGYTPDELIGKQCGDYVLETSRPTWLEARQHIVRGEGVEGVQIEFRRKDGSFAVIELNESPIFKDGRVVGVQAVGRDITERKRLEQIRMDAYQQIERNIEQFAVLGDHVRQPLQVVLGMAELIEDARAAKIIEQVGRINDIIKQLDQGWVESRKVREFIRRYED